jgi:hypothetical protein
MHPNDISAHIGKFEGAERQCAEPRKFDDPYTVEWSHVFPLGFGPTIPVARWVIGKKVGKGPCVLGLGRRTSEVMEISAADLTDRDKAILEFERSWWHETGPKESLIEERFELSVDRYYEILGELLESPAAYEHDPLGVRRLRRLRDRRRRVRQEHAQQVSEPPGS